MNGQKPPKRVFLAMVVVIFCTSLSCADSIGFVPCSIDGTCVAVADSTNQKLSLSSLPQLGEAAPIQTDQVDLPTVAAPKVVGVLPTHLKIDAINLDLTVQNPSTRDINALDTLLKDGPARYVDSVKLGESGTMIIFAHSSHLPIVHNKMFQAFNHIPDLKAGDSITLTGADGKQYLYSVTSVQKTDTSDVIPLASTDTKLVLVTCDTLTGKSARFVLEADYVGTFGPGGLSTSSPSLVGTI